MGNDADFLIRIRTALEDAGISATIEQVEKLTNNLDETGKKGEDAHEKISHGAHKAELSHHELREAVHAVAGQFGGLADVGLWLNPMTAGLAATLFLIDKIKERLNEAKEAAAQLAEQTDRIGEAGMKGFAESVNAAKESMQSLAEEQKKLNTAYAEGSVAMSNRLKLYDQERDAVIKVAEAKEATFEAEIHYEVELGRIGKERAEEIIAQAKLQLDAQRGAADSAKLQMEIEERQQELAKAGFRARNSDEQAIKSGHAAEAPLASKAAASEEAARQAATGKFQSSFTNWRGSQEEFNGTVEDLKKRIQSEHEGQQNAESQNMPEIADRYKHDAEALEEILKSQQKYVENLNLAAELDKQKLAAAKAQTEAAIEQYNHDQEILRTGQDQIDVLQRQLELQKQVTAEVQAQHAAAAGINAKTGQHEEFRHDQEAQEREMVSQARQIESEIRRAAPQDRAGYMGELRGILNSITGLTERNGSEINHPQSKLCGIALSLRTELENEASFAELDRVRTLLNSQRDDLSDLARRVEQMEAQGANNRYH